MFYYKICKLLTICNLYVFTRCTLSIMKKLLLLLFALTFIADCQAQMPATMDVKEFFAQLDDSDLTKKQFFLTDTILGYEGELVDFKLNYLGKDTNLSGYEKTSILQAMTASQVGVWTNEFFDSAKIVSVAYIYSIAKQDPNWTWPAHYSFSLPWFSNDHKFCVLRYEHSCGRRCGEWSVRLYKKVDGHWVFVKFYDAIFS